jgi:hypothetical protein
LVRQGHTEDVESLVPWALVGLLPPNTGEGSTNVARSLRRQFALLGLLLGLTLVGSLWEWTANIAVVVGALIVMVVALWLYSEHGDRPAA